MCRVSFVVKDMFLWRTKENYPLIITKYHPYLFHWLIVSKLARIKWQKAGIYQRSANV